MEENSIDTVKSIKNISDIVVTHQGEWLIDKKNDISVECYVTSDERRIMSLRGTARMMGLTGGGSNALVRNLNSQWIQPYLTEELNEWKQKVENNEIQYVKGVKGKPFIPFDGDLFVDLCKAYIKAKQDGVLNESQSITADKLLGVMSAFAKVGIVALIDEITGFQYERDQQELQLILSKYISKELLPWTSRFPEEYYTEIFRLRNWEYKGKAKTPYVGKLTNQIVYDVLPQNLIEELKRKNPVIENKKYRKYQHHRFLTRETGIPHLDKHLVAVITLMRACNTWEEFESLFGKVFKKEE